MLLGSSGDDTYQGGDGSDEIYGQGGNDTITISGKTGVFSDLIEGGSGDDTLTITYSGVITLGALAITVDGDYMSLNKNREANGSDDLFSSGDWNISLGEGDDSMLVKLKNGDILDMGAGDACHRFQ